MEKESVKKFDLEAAFKALDEIEIPQTKGIKANRVDLKERFGHKPATETLVEDYYDVSSNEDLKDAKEERDGEIAKAKLARIEKIVDLNAESPEDLLPSYVGKVIMQCPQCMTLFYKNPEDIEPSEENPDVVNLNEPCQHCGNTSGYTLIGKVGAVSEDEADKYDETSAEENENELDLDFDKGTEEVDAEGTGEGAKEMSDEETKEESSDEASSDEDLDLDLNLDEVPEEEPEEEKKEESLNLSKETSEDESEHKSENLTLNEEVDKDLDEKLKTHNDYIAYLQQMIKQEEEALKKAENDEIKAAIQRRLDAFTADLEAALPDAVKAEAPVEEITEEPAEEETKAEEEAPVDEALTEETKECKVVLSDKPEKEVFAGTKEECEKIIEKNKETKTAKKHGLKIVEPAADENKTEEKPEKSALKESVESEIDSIIASWDVNESLKNEGVSLNLQPSIADRFTKSQLAELTPEEIKILQEPHKNRAEVAKIIAKYNPKNKFNEAVKAKTTDKLCSVVLNGRQCFVGTKEECEKFIKDHESEEAEKETGGFKLLNTAEIYVNEGLKEYWWEDNDPMNWSDKEPLVYSCYYNSELLGYLEYPYMGREEYPTTIRADIIKHFKLPKDYNSKEISWRYIENEPLDKTKPLVQVNESLKFKTTDKLCSVVLNGRQYFAGTKEECEKFIKYHESEQAAKDMGGYKLLNTAGIYVNESLKEYWWEDNDPMNWSDKEPLVYSCYYNSELLGYLEYQYMGHEEYPTTIKADIIKHFKLPEGYNPKEISWRYIEKEPIDETKPLIQINESLTEEGDLDRLLDSDEFKTPVSEEEINAARREVAKESLKEEKEDESDDEESEAAEIEEPEFNEDDIDELDEDSLNKHIDEYLKEVYSNVKSYETTDCTLKEGKLIVEGKISFNSGKEKLTMFEFLPAYCEGKLFFEGYNKDFSEDKAFKLNCSINESKTLITESFGYKYKINENLVEGLK